jgi:hypothetical protein
LTFYVRNSGQVAFRPQELLWVVFAIGPASEPGELTELRETYNSKHSTTYTQTLTFKGESVTVQAYRGILETPLFHGMRHRLFTADIKSGKPSEYTFWYYFSTPYGVLPEGVEVDHEGASALDLLPRVSVKAPSYNLTH